MTDKVLWKKCSSMQYQIIYMVCDYSNKTTERGKQNYIKLHKISTFVML